MKLLLASTSKYRAELLSRLGYPFDQAKPLFDEDSEKVKIADPYLLAVTLAKKKALSLKELNPDTIIIGSDQVAYLPHLKMVLGKGGSFDGASDQLKLMQGEWHELITAVTLCHNDHLVEYTNITKLKMRKLSKDEIESYLNFDQPFDCAGSYKIESRGISLFEEIVCSDFTAIMGLPLIELHRNLLSFAG